MFSQNVLCFDVIRKWATTKLISNSYNFPTLKVQSNIYSSLFFIKKTLHTLFFSFYILGNNGNNPIVIPFRLITSLSKNVTTNSEWKPMSNINNSTCMSSFPSSRRPSQETLCSGDSGYFNIPSRSHYTFILSSGYFLQREFLFKYNFDMACNNVINQHF